NVNAVVRSIRPFRWREFVVLRVLYSHRFALLGFPANRVAIDAEWIGRFVVRVDSKSFRQSNSRFFVLGGGHEVIPGSYGEGRQPPVDQLRIVFDVGKGAVRLIGIARSIVDD